MLTITNAGNAEGTALAGEALAGRVKAGDVLALFGELGAGKTTFVQGLLKGLNIEDHATSPTFVIANKYQGKDFPVFHIDLYRLDSLSQMEDLGLDDIFSEGSLAVIEWAEKLGPLMPEKRTEVRITLRDDGGRDIRIEDICQ